MHSMHIQMCLIKLWGGVGRSTFSFLLSPQSTAHAGPSPQLTSPCH